MSNHFFYLTLTLVVVGLSVMDCEAQSKESSDFKAKGSEERWSGEPNASYDPKDAAVGTGTERRREAARSTASSPDSFSVPADAADKNALRERRRGVENVPE